MGSRHSADRRSLEMNSHNSVAVRAAQGRQKFHDFKLLDQFCKKRYFPFFSNFV
jgi:hypothetical protein